MNTNILSVPFTEKELAKLSSERNSSFGCFGISLILFLLLTAVFVFLVIGLFNGNSRGFVLNLLIMVPIGFFIVYGFIKSFGSSRKYYADLKAGRKQIITAPVEGKRVNFQRNKTNAKRYPVFFLRAGGFTVRVPKTLYDEIKEGEIINFEIAPYSETIFSKPKRNY